MNPAACDLLARWLMLTPPPTARGRSAGMTATATSPVSSPPRPSARIPRRPDERTRKLAARRRTRPPLLRKALSGDLNAIVMRTLEKDPDHRYGSALEMSEDIDRHLRHEPVVAGPPGVAYRLGRFARRHRAGVAAAGVAVVALVVGAMLGGYVAGEKMRLIKSYNARMAAEENNKDLSSLEQRFAAVLGAVTRLPA